MAIFKSELDDTYAEVPEFEGLFSHDRGSLQVTVKDSLITNEETATARAKVELIKGGYSERYIDITTIHTPVLKQNGTFSFGGHMWVVKEISLNGKPPELYQQIKGLRYE